MREGGLKIGRETIKIGRERNYGEGRNDHDVHSYNNIVVMFIR